MHFSRFNQREWQFPKMKLNVTFVTIGTKLKADKSENFSAFYICL